MNIENSEISLQQIMQNLIVLMEPSKDAHDISWKGGRLFFNRFCIDEDAACELLGVFYLKESWSNLAMRAKMSAQMLADKTAKGYIYSAEYSVLTSHRKNKPTLLI